jgi:hypothetical protein
MVEKMSVMMNHTMRNELRKRGLGFTLTVIEDYIRLLNFKENGWVEVFAPTSVYNCILNLFGKY